MNKDCYLCFYNPNKSLFIETDARKFRLGGALLQTEEDLKENEIEDDTLQQFSSNQWHMHQDPL